MNGPGKYDLECTQVRELPLPAPITWRSVFGWQENYAPMDEQVCKRYKELSKLRHPDNGGTEAAMASLNWAKLEAERELY